MGEKQPGRAASGYLAWDSSPLGGGQQAVSLSFVYLYCARGFTNLEENLVQPPRFHVTLDIACCSSHALDAALGCVPSSVLLDFNARLNLSGQQSSLLDQNYFFRVL